MASIYLVTRTKTSWIDKKCVTKLSYQIKPPPPKKKSKYYKMREKEIEGENNEIFFNTEKSLYLNVSQ